MVKVKICGITNLEDALLAVAAGADMLGFVFAPSPRKVAAEQAQQICNVLPSHVTKVGVFVDSDLALVKQVILQCSLQMVQLHGAESPRYCRSVPCGVIKGFRVKNKGVLDIMALYQGVGAFLLDGYVPGKAGGTGVSFDWTVAREARKYGKVFLAGGLTPENVGRAISEAEPYAVDVSSGVETRPGKKDSEKIVAFIQAAKGLKSQSISTKSQTNSNIKNQNAK